MPRPCRSNGAGFVGKGWVGLVFSPGTVDCSHWPFFDRPDGFTGFAVQDEQERLFGRLRQRS